MVIVWFAVLMSVGMDFLLTVLNAPASNSEPQDANRLTIVVATGLGALFVVSSFVVRQKLVNRSIEKQDIGLVQKATIAGMALCEVPALLGLLLHFIFGIRQYYWLLLLAAGGMVLHFPRRSQLEAARWSPPGSLMPRE